MFGVAMRLGPQAELIPPSSQQAIGVGETKDLTPMVKAVSER